MFTVGPVIPLPSPPDLTSLYLLIPVHPWFIGFRRRSAAHSSRTRPRRTANNWATGIHRATRPPSYRGSSCKACRVTRTDSSATNKVISGKFAELLPYLSVVNIGPQHLLRKIILSRQTFSGKHVEASIPISEKYLCIRVCALK